MREIKLLHAADLHLDSPFEGLGGEKAALRRKEQRALLGRMTELAKNEAVDLVLLSGDLLDSDSPYSETSEELLRSLEKMQVPVFISPGNHDPYTARSPYAKLRFPENVHIFKGAMECVELKSLGVRVFGAGFTDKYSAPLLEGFSAEKKSGVLDLMCLHGEVSAFSNYNPISEKMIAESKMDYIALGHIHKGSGLKQSGDTCYAWPGCTEGRGFDETGEKHVYIVTVSEKACRLRPVSIAKRKYMKLAVSPRDGDIMSAINAALPKDTADDIYRIVLEGEVDATPDIAAISSLLSDGFFALQIKDNTRPKTELWERAGEDSLRGQFLLRLKLKLDAAATEEEKRTVTQAARWGLAALDKREEVVCRDNK